MLEDSIKWGHANAGKALAKGAGDLKRKGAGKRKCAGVGKRKRGEKDVVSAPTHVVVTDNVDATTREKLEREYPGPGW